MDGENFHSSDTDDDSLETDYFDPNEFNGSKMFSKSPVDFSAYVLLEKGGRMKFGGHSLSPQSPGGLKKVFGQREKFQEFDNNKDVFVVNVMDKELKSQSGSKQEVKDGSDQFAGVLTKGLTLADLAKSHGAQKASDGVGEIMPSHQPMFSALANMNNSALSKQSSGTSLAELAKVHGSNLSGSLNPPQTKTTGTVLPPGNVPGKEAFGKDGFSLTDLGKAHTAKSPLSTKLLSSASNVTFSINTLGSNKSLAELVSAQSKTSPLLTGSKSSLASVSLSNSKPPGQSMGISLAALAQAHGVHKQTSQFPQSQVNKVNETKVTDKPTSRVDLSDIAKSKGDKIDIMLSLSNLVNKHVSSASQCKDRSNKSQEDLTKSGAEVEIAKDQNKNDSFNVTKEATQVKLNIASAKSVATTTAGSSPKLNLKDLVKDRNPLVPKNTGTDNKEANTDRETTAVQDIETDTGDISLTTDENVLEKMLRSWPDLNDESSAVDVKHLLRSFSNIGYTLCLKRDKVESKDKTRYKKKHFRYQYQVRNLMKEKEEELREIKPFDFSSPSPDDVVKQKQKIAFSRSGH